MIMQSVHIAVLALCWTSQSPASDALGIFRVNPDRSTTRYSNIAAIGFQLHVKGEVFTLSLRCCRPRHNIKHHSLFRRQGQGFGGFRLSRHTIFAEA
jgi:hypothetical protein